MVDNIDIQELKIIIMKPSELAVIMMPLNMIRGISINSTEKQNNNNIKVSEIIQYLNIFSNISDIENVGFSTFGRKLKIDDSFNPLIENRFEITLPITIDPNTARLLRYKKSKSKSIL